MIQKVTIGFGALYVLIGILGFIPGITRDVADPGPVPMEGELLGIFAVNLIHNLAHIGIGLALAWGAMRAERVMLTNRIMTAVFALLVVASLIAPIVEGVAINAPDTILHVVSVLVVGYLGFIAPQG
ncbi:MAG TPA: DUF4383 domain-containing protein [Thermomicrobiales bacterium]|nr:DUF4383 domain-containing protein [Thermomicrobiales bacterium]